jgi:predicted dienelactone hydrolase
MALVALGRGRSREVSRAIDYLVSSQEADGLWSDKTWSGVVFPGMSYTGYNLAATCGAIVSIHRALQVRAAT